MVNELGLVGGALGALVASIAHFVAHTAAGEESAFDNAGVMEAGITIALVGFLIGYMGATGEFTAFTEWALEQLQAQTGGA